MARPEKQPHERRTSRFNLRFTEAENAYVREQALAAGLDPTEYLRRRALGYQVPAAEGRADARLLSELNRLGVELRAIGNLVNQLARAMHTGRSFQVSWTSIYDRLQHLTADVSKALGEIAR